MPTKPSSQYSDTRALDEVMGKDPLDFVAESDITKVAGYIKAMESRKEAPSRFEYLGKKKRQFEFPP